MMTPDLVLEEEEEKKKKKKEGRESFLIAYLRKEYSGNETYNAASTARELENCPRATLMAATGLGYGGRVVGILNSRSRGVRWRYVTGFSNILPQYLIRAQYKESMASFSGDVASIPSAVKAVSRAGPPLHDMLKNVSWLLGKWRSEEGMGKYPTIKDFKYGEEVEFTHVGQPNLQFSCYSWKLADKKPLHRELGFVRVQPGTNKVALIIAENLGVCELEEGEVIGQELRMESHTLGRITFGKDPATKKVRRVFRREGDTLHQLVEMETANTPMTEHFRIKYQKVD